MHIVIVGAGVIGSVYGAHLGAAGHRISVLAHGERTTTVSAQGLRVRDVTTGSETYSPAELVSTVRQPDIDLVLVAVRREQLSAVAAALAEVPPGALVLFMGNNPSGRSGLPGLSEASVALGFPGVGGSYADGLVTYYRIAQQPTAIEASDEPRLAALSGVLASRGLAVQRVPDMDGWLAYHAVFIAAVSAALYRCGTDPVRLAGDRGTLKLMCAAITEGFQALKAMHVGGCPRNLATLHSPWLAPVAVTYWARAMRSPMGELAFAAHARRAETEMRGLASDVMNEVAGTTATAAIHKLLTGPQPQ